MNKFMQAAIAEAEKALQVGREVPVGAVIVLDGEIIAAAHNRREELFDPTAHAEILVIREAAKKLCDWRLSACDLYVTLEPCDMCMATIREARIRRLYCGAYAPKDAPEIFPETYYGIEEERCSAVLKAFFAGQRGPKTGADLDPGCQI